MKNRFILLFGLLVLVIARPAEAQITLSPSDTTVCPLEHYTIFSSFSSQYGNITIDDQFDNSITPIGFPFVFYGDTVTKCVISANNFISFDTALAGLYSNWVYNAAKLGTNHELGSVIMFPFQDINMGLPNPGHINYQTFGVKPNRTFVVEFCQTKLFECEDTVTDQVVLHEGTNIIDINIKTKPSCTWNGGTAVEGLRHNGNQDLVPGRDAPNLPWVGLNDSRRFTYNGNNTYTIDSVAYNYVPIIADADTSDLIWYEEGNPNPIHTGGSLYVTPNTSIHYYVATITGHGCDDITNYTFADTSWMHIGTIYDTTNASICEGSSYPYYGMHLIQSGQYDTAFTSVGGCDSFLTLNLTVYTYPIVTLTDSNEIFVCPYTKGAVALTDPSSAYTYQWFLNDVPTADTSFNLLTDVPGLYKVRVDNHGCADTSITLPISLDTAHASFTFKPSLGCMEDTLHVSNLSDPGSYWWNFGDGTTPDDTLVNPAHIYAQQNIYNVRLIAVDTLGCSDTTYHLVDIRHPLVAGFTQSADSVCQTAGAPVQFADTSIGNITNRQWDFGDGSALATEQNPSHNFTLAGTHQIRLIIGDSIPCYDTAIHTIYVDSFPFLKLVSDRNAICVGDEVNFTIDYLQPSLDVHWNFGDNAHWDQAMGTHHSYDRPGTFWASVTVVYPVCAAITATDSIIVSMPPVVNLGPDSSLCLNGNPIFLKNLAVGNNPMTQWLWNTGDTTQILKVVHPGTYSLRATLDDCSTTEQVIVSKDCYTDIPNAFTPNGDGSNDYFYPRQLLTEGVTAFRMSIYNRWGEMVFETASTNGRGWDGKFNDKDQPMGVYIYKISVTYKNGKTENYTGNVTLVR